MYYLCCLFASVGFLFVLTSPLAYADVGSPKSAGIAQGRVSIEYKGTRTGSGNKLMNNDQGHEFEVYYGLTERIKLGFERYYENEPLDHFESEAYTPNVTFQTTRQGQWWLSSAIFGQYVFEDGDPDSVKLVMIGERAQGPFILRGNLGLGRDIGGGRDHGVGLDSVLQGLYRATTDTLTGIEWHADYGTIDTFSEGNNHKHYVGPVLTGNLFRVGDASVQYAAGYYWGLSDASADNAQRVMLKYEMQF